MPKPATYLTYYELFDRMPTKAELDSAVRVLNPFHTVVLTARLNTMFRHAVWSKNPQDAGALEKFQHWFAVMFLNLETKQRLEARFGVQNPARRPLWHPLQSFNVLKLALTFGEGDESARPDISETDRVSLGTACLMVNDLFCTPEEQTNLKTGSLDERRKQLMLQCLTSIEISNPTPPRNLLFRSYATYRIILANKELVNRIRRDCGGLDITKDFEAQFGISIMDWLSLVFGVQSLLLMHTQEDLLSKPESFLINRKTMLTSSALTQKQIETFFDMLSMSFDELKTEVRNERPVDDRLDLVPFKSKPLIVTAPDNYACLDLGLLTEKLHDGPYFQLINSLPEDERWKIFNAWGLVFEKYVNWLIQGIDGRQSVAFYPDTHWDDGSRAFDGVCLKKRLIVVVEHKGGFLRQDARYSNDLNKFMTDLQKKIGEGCHQLARDIAAAFPEQGNGRRLRDVPIPSNPIVVMPVLVVQDLILRAPFINYFLNQRFQAELAGFSVKKSLQVLPLNVVQITQLESLVEMAEAFDFDLINFLHRRCQLDRQMLGDLQDFISAVPEASRDRCSARF